jgi:hypothetical protein
MVESTRHNVPTGPRTAGTGAGDPVIGLCAAAVKR